MKIGIMDEVVRGAFGESFTGAARPLEACFAGAASLGVQGIEINVQLERLKRDLPGFLREVSALRDHHGLAVPSLVMGEHNNGGLATWWCDPNEKADEVLLTVQACAELGAPVLLLPFFFFNEPKGASHRAAVAERLQPLCRKAHDVGVTIAFEGVTPAEHVVEMAETAGPGFGVYFDPANTAWCDRDPAEEARTFGSLIVQAHAKDAATFTGDASLGQGKVDHAACAEAYRAIGFDGWVVLETPGGESMPDDLALARKVYGGAE
ncbi:MAG: sugar phosphate isomerase/epimerase family protein [Planctomycetota bacterium]